MSFGKFAGCHQRPDRSFFINGHQFPVCARCTGVLIGQYSALILYRILSLPAVILVSFCAVMFLDWLLQYLDMIITNIFTTTDKLSNKAQLPRTNAGKYSWLTGLLKCAKCGYALKVSCVKIEQRCKLICSGRSNFGNCDAAIDVDLRELEDYNAHELQNMIDDCPAELPAIEDNAQAEAILAVEQKIDRLVTALAESSEISASYISKQIEKLHAEREHLLHEVSHPAPQLLQFDFLRASFDEKKLVAAEFIERIEIEGKNVNITWKT